MSTLKANGDDIARFERRHYMGVSTISVRSNGKVLEQVAYGSGQKTGWRHMNITTLVAASTEMDCYDIAKAFRLSKHFVEVGLS